ncbi:MbtH family protein [Paenibacillus hodogayensis]|uniref:MbtH family protein n=1 Tax=Paenibacillus hodogayensis TaxID=279208 RepID=A0ABV5VZ27_9BACL
MNNPFEQADGVYQVLINEEGQYSLWPAFVDVPSGWQVVYERQSRHACLDYIGAQWTDMRPLSLRQAAALPGADGVNGDEPEA